MWTFIAGCNRSSANKDDVKSVQVKSQNPLTPQALYAEAQSKFDTGDFSAAVSASQKAAQISSGDSAWIWKFRLLHAEALLWEGHYKETLSCFESPPLPPTSVAEFNIRRKLIEARALYNEDEYEKAQSRLTTANKLARRQVPDLLADIALGQAGLFHHQDLDKQAEVELKKAERLASHYKNEMLRAKIFGTFGQVYTAERYYDKALDSSFQALIISKSLNAQHIEAGARLNMGWSYLELGDFDQAISYFQDSEALATHLGLEKTRQEVLNSLGRIYYNERKYERASEYYNRALTVAKSREDQDSIGIYSDNLALVALALGHLEEAERYNQEALKILIKRGDHLEELKALRASASIADAKKEFSKGESILHSLLTNKATPTSIRWEAEGELAGLYVDIGKNEQAQIEFNKALNILDRSWDTIERDENKLAFSTWAADFYSDYIRFLASKGENAEAFQIAESMRARTLSKVLGTSASRNRLLPLLPLQRFLRRTKQVILAFWLAPEGSFLWVITPSQLKLFALPPKQQIEDKVENYQKNIINLGNPLKDNQAGQELYRILIEPARELIPPETRVTVIPDGNLGKLNFETLIVPGVQPHYWIEDVEVKDSSSISVLMHSRPDHLHGHRLLIIGDPIEVTSEYRRLQHAKDEMKAATDHFRNTDKKPISGADAKPSSYASNKPGQYDFIHFATHGFASDTKPLDSAIVLSPDANGNFKLYGRDIITIPIKAEVVTISACYGAGERTYSGEGLVGLAWAFLRAGAHRVIAGLWKVDDDSTPQLMNTFYADVRNGMRPAAALRDAKRKMLHSGTVFRFPYYWASLQLYAGS